MRPLLWTPTRRGENEITSGPKNLCISAATTLANNGARETPARKELPTRKK